MPNVTILKGPYCSGKTTWAIKYCNKYKNTIRICRKDILRSIAGGRLDVHFVKIADKMCDAAIYDAIKNNYDIIIDDEHFVKERITDEMLKILRYANIIKKEKGIDFETNIKIKKFLPPLFICLKRNRNSLSPKKQRLIVKSYQFFVRSDS